MLSLSREMRRPEIQYQGLGTLSEEASAISRRGDLLAVAWSGPAVRRGAGRSGREPRSYELRPVVVGHELGSSPLLAVRVCAVTGKEAILGVFEDRQPR